MTRTRPVLFAFFGSLLLSGCMATGGPTFNPVGRTLTWFSYVGGDDIRVRCVPGSLDVWRFVYNGHYMEQIRSYDMTADQLGPGAILQVRAAGRSTVLAMDLRDPFSVWRGQIDQRFLQANDRRKIVDALAASGFSGPAPEGLRLRSDAFYWAVSACQGGVFHFNAWQQPGTDLSRLAFIKTLLDVDRTGLPLNPPNDAVLPPYDPSPRAGYVQFLLTVGKNGLVSGPTY
ncbi:MAG TPA: hypothetical protein VEU47_09630 [Candidatus Cybelea sp.]|nr:hypothetical protein [Candidatus Cybelea sp.]